MPPPQLFPKIPYTRQRGRLGGPIVRGERITYSDDEVALIRTALFRGSRDILCPRCHQLFNVGGPVVLQQGGKPVWVVRCEPCSVRMSVSPRAFVAQRKMRCSGLVHSSRPARPLKSRVPQMAAAVAVHAAVVVAAVTLTLPQVEQPAAPADTAVISLPSPRSARAELARIPPPPAMQGLANIRGFTTVTPPIEVPHGIQPASLAPQFDPKQFSGVGSEGGSSMGSTGGVLGGTGHDPNYIWPSITLLDEPPILISSPPLVYPAAMQNLGIEGHVVFQFVIDTLGLTEQLTVRMIRATHPAFVDSARDIVCKSRYRPGRIRGFPVRVRSVIRIEFTLTP